MPELQTAEAPRLEARFAPATFDADARTVELAWGRGIEVERMDWRTEQRFTEILAMDPASVDLSRLQAGAPLLDTHSRWSLDGVLGVVERAWIVGGEGRAVVRFSSRDEVKPVLRDVQDGIIRNVSVGYSVEEWKTERGADGKMIRTAVRWTPSEISLVPVPADASAQVRAAGDAPASPPGTPTTPKEARMAEVPNAPVQPAPAPAPAPQVVEPTRATPPSAPPPAGPSAASMEDLEAIATRAKLGNDFIVAQLKAKATPDQARDAALDALARQAPQFDGAGRVSITRDEVTTRRELMSEALAHRAAHEAPFPGQKAPAALSDGARQYRHLSLLSLAEECLNAAGIRTRGMSPQEIAEIALRGDRSNLLIGRAGEHSTSDFPLILANTASKALRDAFETMQRTFVPWTQRKDLPDFKTFSSLDLGGIPGLQPQAEGGGVNYVTLTEGGETWQLASYNAGIALTFRAMINDDLGAFARIPGEMADAAAALESDIVYAQILANANMADGGALFNATAASTAGGHANLYTTSASALTADAAGIAAVGKLNEFIGLQTKRGTSQVIGKSGRWLLVPKITELVARQLFEAGYVAATPNVVNPMRGEFQVIAEPRLQRGVTVGATTVVGSTTAFFLIAAGIDTVHWGYLRGESGPRIASMADFDTDGMKLKVTHHFGAKAVEWRGMAKSAGA